MVVARLTVAKNALNLKLTRELTWEILHWKQKIKTLKFCRTETRSFTHYGFSYLLILTKTQSLNVYYFF